MNQMPTISQWLWMKVNNDEQEVSYNDAMLAEKIA
jgi:hypothetical protein